ncbi:uncharacterized protein SCHCODRAFT_02612150 [Schizophyllum commune H4-8]|nr:uncharacterized protein SCHCODRAFT_02612150 [Schizophyllum commune H4-8]KAI5898458.1 hypothetical protein SCHCODRAFT_02612150 [Schizophyllum commune H4-8]
MPSFPLPQGSSREADHISIYSADADGSDDSEADAAGEDDIDECEEFLLYQSAHNSPEIPFPSASTSRDISNDSTLVSMGLNHVSKKLAQHPPFSSTPTTDDCGPDGTINPPSVPKERGPRSVHDLFSISSSGETTPLTVASSSRSTPAPREAPLVLNGNISPGTVVIHRAPRIPLPSKRKPAGGLAEGRTRKRARMTLDYVAVPSFPAGVSRDDYEPSTSSGLRQRPAPSPEVIDITSSSSSSRVTTPTRSRAASVSTARESHDSIFDLIIDTVMSPPPERMRLSSPAPLRAPRAASTRRTFDSLADALNNLNEDVSSSDDEEEEEEGIATLDRRRRPSGSRPTRAARSPAKRPRKRPSDADAYNPRTSGVRRKKTADKRELSCSTRHPTPKHTLSSLSATPKDTPSPHHSLSPERRPSEWSEQVESLLPSSSPPEDVGPPPPIILPIATSSLRSRAAVLLNSRHISWDDSARQSRHAQALRQAWEEEPIVFDLTVRPPTSDKQWVKVAKEEPNGEEIPPILERQNPQHVRETSDRVEAESSATSYTGFQGIMPPLQPPEDDGAHSEPLDDQMNPALTLLYPDDFSISPTTQSNDHFTPPPLHYSQMPTCATPAELQDLSFRFTVTAPSIHSYEIAAIAPSDPPQTIAPPSPHVSAAGTSTTELPVVDPHDVFNTDFLSVTDDHLSATGTHGRPTRAASPVPFSTEPSTYNILHIPFGGTEEAPLYGLEDDLQGRVDNWMHGAGLAAEPPSQDLHGLAPSAPASTSAEPQNVAGALLEVPAAPFAPSCSARGRSRSPGYSVVSSRPSSPASSRAGSSRDRSPSVPLATQSRKRKRRAGVHPPPDMAGPDAKVNYKTFKWPMKAGIPYTKLCHQCRQAGSTSRLAMVCACGKHYCSRCIILRYHGVIDFDPKADFTCPHCEKYCSCDLCCRDRGEAFISLKDFMDSRAVDGASTSVLHASPPPEMDATIEMNHMDGPSRSYSPARRRATRRPFVVQRRGGPVTFWGTMYDLEGVLVGKAYGREVADEDPGNAVVSRPDAPQAAHARRATGRRMFIGAVQKSWGRIDKRKITFADGQGGRGDREISTGAHLYVGNRTNLMRPIVPADEEEAEDDAPITSIQWTRDSSVPPPAWDSEDIGIRDEHVVAANALQNLLDFELGGGDWEPYSSIPA